MKRITLLLSILCLTFTEICAQVYIGDNTIGIDNSAIVSGTVTEPPVQSEGEVTDSKKKYSDIFDFTFDYDKDAKQFGVMVGNDHFNMGMSFGDNLFNLTFGYGFGSTYIYDDTFLIKGRLYPYAGFWTYKDDIDFLYGAAGNIDVGLRLWKTVKGNSGFVTVGYNITAPEFDTTGLFKNGYWGFGISIVYW